MTRIYLQKNDTSKNEKIPYFTLKLVPDDDAEDQDWKEIGVFWKAKTGVGYSGFLSDGVKIDASAVKNYQKKQDED